MAVYTSYDLKPQYYTGAVSGCINGGEDYRTVGNKEVIQDVNLMVNPQMSGLSNACTITNFKMSCQYRLTNTSNNSGLTLRGGFYWYPSFVENPTISGTSLTMGSNNLDPAGNVTFLADSILTINSESRGNTEYSSFSQEVQPSIGNLNGKNVLIGAHFAFQSLNSVSSCRMWLKNVTFTITRTRACYIYWNTGVDSVGTVQTKYDYGVVPAYSGNLSKAGYTFKGWKASNGTVYTGSLPTAGETDVTYTAVWELNAYTVTFKNADGSVVSTKTVNSGATLGTLPTVSRSGYTFAGWIPCAPVIKTDGSVLDSYQYNGGTAYPLDKKYKYTNNLSVHIEAYMSNWEDIVQRQIISCTEGGGWGIGYQANTTGHGSELYAGGYKGIDLGFGTAGKFSNNTWYLFDLVFSNGVFEVYQDGVKKGSQTTTNTSISYNADNTIFVGAEAAKNTTTPAGNYFKGYISNVFIANQGTRLEIATTSTVVNNNTDYYPIWRKNTTFTATFKNHDGTVLQTVSVEYGSTPSYTGTTPTKSSTAEYSYSFSGWSPSVGAITSATTYTAQFTATKRKYNLTASAGTGGSVTGGGTYEYGKTATLTAIPNSGYKFKQWSDGVTTATRSVTVTGNATYTAYFEVDKINKIYVGTAQPKAIYVGTTPVKAVYIGTTKIYG